MELKNVKGFIGRHISIGSYVESAFKIYKNSIKCKFIWKLPETLSLFIHYPTLVLIFNLTISIFQYQH